MLAVPGTQVKCFFSQSGRFTPRRGQNAHFGGAKRLCWVLSHGCLARCLAPHYMSFIFRTICYTKICRVTGSRCHRRPGVEVAVLPHGQTKQFKTKRAQNRFLNVKCLLTSLPTLWPHRNICEAAPPISCNTNVHKTHSFGVTGGRRFTPPGRLAPPYPTVVAFCVCHVTSRLPW